jgi:hypothetical protein
MKRSAKISLIIGGLLLGLAAFPVFGQDPVVPPSGVVNKRPLADFSDYVKDSLATKEVDLTAPFSIEMEGYLTNDGKIDLTRTKFTRTDGNEQILRVVKTGIAAVGDSGYFKYLSALSDKTFHLSMVQDDANFSLAIQSGLDSSRHAKTFESLFKFYLSTEIEKKSRPEAAQNEKDDLALLKGASIASEGKRIIVKVSIPKSVIHEIIRRKLAASGRVPGMPNGMAENIRVL